MGSGTSSVRRTIFSSSIFSRSRTMTGPSLDFMAIFGKTIFGCMWAGAGRAWEWDTDRERAREKEIERETEMER